MKFFANVPHFYRQTLNFLCIIFTILSLSINYVKENFRKWFHLFENFTLLRKMMPKNGGSYGTNIVFFRKWCKWKRKKKGFAKIIRHGRLMAKIDNMLIIRALAIFRFFANVCGFKTIAVKFIKLLTSDKKKPPSMWFYIRLAHFRCYLVYILSSSFTSWSRSGGNHGFFDFFPYLCTQIAKWTWKRLQLSIVSI